MIFPYVTIIVLNWNGCDDTLRCLSSLTQLDYSSYSIMVVDNCSTDNSVAAIRAAYPQIEVVTTDDNLGYVGGNNLGMEIALKRGTDLIFLLNNDTLIDPSCVSDLVQTLQSYPNIGVIGPMVYTWDNQLIVSSAGGQIDWRNADAINVGIGQLDRGQFPARAVDFINGCGLMITREAIERVGMLDPKFFMYWEETDWCQRIKRAGFGVRFEPRARMKHKAPINVEELGPTTLYYMTRNRFLFFARHTPLTKKPLTLARAFHGAIRGSLIHRQAGRTIHARATEVAIWHALQQRWGRTSPAVWRAASV
jgi:hypothetical protein